MTDRDDFCDDCGLPKGNHKLSPDGHICPPLDLAVVAITLTKQAVNCGDHAQDIEYAVGTRRDETVEHLIRRTLITRGWDGKPEPHGDYYLTIRVAAEELVTLLAATTPDQCPTRQAITDALEEELEL